MVEKEEEEGERRSREDREKEQREEEEESGVVEGPNLKVKDIRAMFRGGPDYQDFAKPRVHAKPRSIKISSSISSSNASDNQASSNMNTLSEQVKSPVSQQVMGLFRGAFEIEKSAASGGNGVANGNGAQTNGDQTIVKPVPPVRKHKPAATVKKASDSTMRPSMVESTSSESSEGKEGLKRSIERIKSESGLVESFEKSLDEFYDVFDNLTS